MKLNQKSPVELNKMKKTMLKLNKNNLSNSSENEKLESQISKKRPIRNFSIRVYVRFYLIIKVFISFFLLIINIGSCITTWGNPINLTRFFKKLDKFEDKYIYIQPITRKGDNTLGTLVIFIWYILYGRRKQASDDLIRKIEKQVTNEKIINYELTRSIEKIYKLITKVLNSFQEISPEKFYESTTDKETFSKEKIIKPLNDVLIEAKKIKNLGVFKELDNVVEELEETLQEFDEIIQEDLISDKN